MLTLVNFDQSQHNLFAHLDSLHCWDVNLMLQRFSLVLLCLTHWFHHLIHSLGLLMDWLMPSYPPDGWVGFSLALNIDAKWEKIFHVHHHSWVYSLILYTIWLSLSKMHVVPGPAVMKKALNMVLNHVTLSLSKGFLCCSYWRAYVPQVPWIFIWNCTWQYFIWEKLSSWKVRSITLPKCRQNENTGTASNVSIANKPAECGNSPELPPRGLPPLVSALKASAEQNAVSFHFPGHNRGHAAPASMTQLIGIRR